MQVKGFFDIRSRWNVTNVERSSCLPRAFECPAGRSIGLFCNESVYEDLTKDDLLTRCLGAETQNNNESLNSLIWTFNPKHLHSGPKIVEIATFLAVMIFNEGFVTILKTMSTMGCEIGRGAQAYVHYRDQARIDRSERRSYDFAKQARIEARKEEAALRDFYETEEGVLYGPGIAD